jgi:hypothetical protein
MRFDKCAGRRQYYENAAGAVSFVNGGGKLTTCSTCSGTGIKIQAKEVNRGRRKKEKAEE